MEGDDLETASEKRRAQTRSPANDQSASDQSLDRTGAQLTFWLSFSDPEDEEAYQQGWVMSSRRKFHTFCVAAMAIHYLRLAVMVYQGASNGLIYSGVLLVTIATGGWFTSGMRAITEGPPTRWMIYNYVILLLVYTADAVQFVVDGLDGGGSSGGTVGNLRFFPIMIILPCITMGTPWHHSAASGCSFTVAFALCHRLGLFPRIALSSDDMATMAAYLGFGTVVAHFHEARIRQAWMLTRRLRQAKDAADAGVRAKSLFLSNTNHELRTPLHGIIGMTDLLMETPLSGQQLEYLQTVRRCSESLLAMVCDILDLEKAEAGQLELERRPFLLRDALEAVTDIVFVGAQRAGVDIASLVEGGLASRRVVGDVTRFRQVLLNLASNAVKFSSRGAGGEAGRPAPAPGHVLIRAEAADPPPGDPRTWVRVSVKDDGIGIPADRMGQLFRPFSQLDSTHTRKYGGTGLGLALAKTIIERMGGSIAVSSTPGEGALFTATLPFEACEAESAADAQPHPPQLSSRAAPPHCRRPSPLPPPTLAAPAPAHAAAVRVRLWRSSTLRALEETLPSLRYAPLDPAALDRFPQAVLVTDCPEEAVAARASRPPRPVVELVTPGRSVEEGGRIPGRLLLPVKLEALRRALEEAAGAALAPPSSSPPSSSSPASASSPSSPPPPPPAPLRAVRGRHRALIAEDNEVNARVLSRILGRLGFELAVVENGQEAVDAARSGRFDVVVTDISMPVKSGLEACRDLRALQAAGEAPPSLIIIGCSANATKEDRERGMAAGMDGYLQKPCRLPQIEAALLEVGALERAPGLPPAPDSPRTSTSPESSGSLGGGPGAGASPGSGSPKPRPEGGGASPSPPPVGSGGPPEIPRPTFRRRRSIPAADAAAPSTSFFPR
eukprot:tig00020904_g15159.t1